MMFGTEVDRPGSRCTSRTGSRFNGGPSESGLGITEPPLGMKGLPGDDDDEEEDDYANDWEPDSNAAPLGPEETQTEAIGEDVADGAQVTESL